MIPENQLKANRIIPALKVFTRGERGLLK